MAGGMALGAVVGSFVGAPARLMVDARAKWKATKLMTKRRPKKARAASVA